MDPTDSQLVAYLTGVLDPGRVVALEAELQARPELRRRLQALQTVRRRTQPRPRAPKQRIYLPPAGAWGAARRRAVGQRIRAMGDAEEVQPGDRIRLSLHRRAGDVLALYWQGGEHVEQMIPRPGQPPIAVERLPSSAAGDALLEVVVQPQHRRQRWMLVVGRPEELAHLSDSPEADAFLRLTSPDSSAQVLVHAENVRLPEDR
jgi:hypothetical protein